MRRAAFAFAILLTLAVAALLFAPQLLDVNRLKAPIIDEIAAQTGYRFELTGPIRLSLLPSPAITARGVRLANPPGAAISDMVRLRAVDVKLAFWPLLTGNITVRRLVLVEPEIDLERLADGRINWLAAGDSDTGKGAREARSTSDGHKLDIAIERLDVQDGAVTYRSPGAIERFEHIGARLSIGGPSGPFGAQGALVARGASLQFDGQISPLGRDDVSLQLNVTSRPAAKLQIEAVMSGDDRKLRGQLKFTADDLQDVAATTARLPVPAAFAQPLSLSARIGGTASDVALDGVTLDLGSAHGQGSLHLAMGMPLRVRAALTVDRVDVDHWPAGRRAMVAPSGMIGSAFAAAPDATATIPAGTAGVAGAPSLPRDIEANVDLGVQAVLWRNGVVRNTRLKANLADGKLTIDRLATNLPGGSDTSLSGVATMTADGLHLEGGFQAAADDLRGLGTWLGLSVASIPADRLRRASLKGQFAMTPARLDIGEFKGIIDSTKVDGAATLLLRERPGIGLRITADRLNLDAYLPRPADAAAALVPSASVQAGGAADAVDLNLDARVDALTWRNQSISDLHLAATLLNGDATIRELGIGDLGGASGKLSGSIAGISGAAPKAKLDMALQGPELERVVRLFAPQMAGRFYGPFALEGAVAGDAESMTADLKLDVLEGHAHIGGTLAPGPAKVDLNIDADCPSTERVLRIFSAGYRPAGGDPGPFKLAGHLTGEGDALTLDGLSLAMGANTLEGKLALDLAGARPHLAADLKLGDWSIDRLLPAKQTAALDERYRASLVPGAVLAEATAPSEGRDAWPTTPIDFADLAIADADISLTGHSLAYGSWRIDEPSLAAKLKDGILSLGTLSGRSFGGNLQASGAIDASGATPALKAHATLADADLKEVLADAAGANGLGGRFAAEIELTTGGGTAQELAAHLAGSATLDAHDGTLAGIDLNAVNSRAQAAEPPRDLAALLASGAGGATAFSRLGGNFHIDSGTALSNDLQLAAPSGQGQGSVSLDLAHWTMTSRWELRLAGLPGAPPFVMHADGPIEAPHVAFDVGDLQQFLDARRPSKPAPAAAPAPAPPVAAAPKSAPPAAAPAPPPPAAASPPPASAPTAAAPSPADQEARQRLNRILRELFPQP